MIDHWEGVKGRKEELIISVTACKVWGPKEKRGRKRGDRMHRMCE